MKRRSMLRNIGRRLEIPPRNESSTYLSGVAVFGVGMPAAVIAVMAAPVFWKIVCASLVAKYRVPEVPGATGWASEK
jgi:hypothetical protein